MSKTKQAEPRFTIAAVERDVGLSKDVLRVWERRYGFPAPERDEHGERLYPASQVDRLREIRRLMDQGLRPGRLLAMTPKELAQLSASRRAVGPAAGDDAAADGLQALVALIRRHDMPGFQQALHQRLARQGLQRFVQDTIAPMAALIGTAWARGELQVYEEHLFTELAGRVLRQAIAAVPGGPSPRVLLTTVPPEQHAMGLLMVEATLALEGAHCISLGTQMPLLDIAGAAVAHQADIVALSFSTVMAPRQIATVLGQLRGALPGATALWAGGSGVRKVAAPEGVALLASFEQAVDALASWRQR